MVYTAAGSNSGCICRLNVRLMSARFSRQRLVLTAGTIALTLLFGGLSYYYAKQFYHESASELRLLGLELDRITPEKSLIIAANYGDPTVFYYAERRVWHFSERGAIYNGHTASS